MARVDKVAEGIYRICTVGEGDFQFNQFVIEDERPALIHTGMYPMYEDVRRAVAEVMDPARLAYIIVPHDQIPRWNRPSTSSSPPPSAPSCPR